MSYRVILSDIEGKRSVESPENPFEEYGWAKEYVESELCSHAAERLRCEYVSSDDCSMIPRVDRSAKACCAIVGQIGHLCQLGRVPSVCRRA